MDNNSIPLNGREDREVLHFQGNQCDQCSKTYKTKDSLSRHVKAKHFGVAFPCGTCGKAFEYIGAKTRHEKTCIGKKATKNNLQCSICCKKFAYVSNKLHHEKTCQGKDHLCNICGKRCSTAGGLERHQEVHKKTKPERKRKGNTPTSPPVKRQKPVSMEIKSPEAGPSSYRCRRCTDTFLDRHQLYLHGMKQHYQVGGGLQQLPWDVAPWENEDGTIDEDLKEVYDANRPLILQEDRPGAIQSVFNFPVNNDVTIHQLNRFATEIYDREQHAFKINLSFGFILQHRETGQYRYFTPYNNTTVMELPMYISKRKDLRRFYLHLRRLDILEQLLRQRPDTKWIPVLITNVQFYITSTNYPVGEGDLPDYIINKSSLHALIKNKHNGKPYDDNLCLFRCLALHRNHEVRCLEGPTKEYYQCWKDDQKTEEPFPGVSMDQFPKFEELFKVDLEVYSLAEEDEARSIYKSRGRYNNSLYVNLYQNHLSYIKDFSTYAIKYRCHTCDRHFIRSFNLHRHQLSCSGKTKYVYPGGFHKTQETIFEKLEAFDIYVPKHERTFPYFMCYDFEAVLQKTDDCPTNYLSWTEKHVPISVSICSNVPDYRMPHCIIETDQDKLIKDMVEYMKTIADKVKELTEEKWVWVVDEIEKRVKKKRGKLPDFSNLPIHLLEDDSDDDDNEEEEDTLREEEEEDTLREEEEEDKALLRLYGEFQGYLSQVPVLAFNSAKYDLNLVKRLLTRHLNMHEEKGAYVIKKNNSYAVISTPQLKFLDLSQFLAPGSSYASFLKAYGVKEQKGYFPYQWFDSVEKLNYITLPTHEEFYSELKKLNITEEEYQYCQQVWKDQGMQTFKDFLVWYNNLDVGPFVEGVEKFQEFYFDKGVDLFKTAVSIPGIARQRLFQSAKEQNAGFSLFDQFNADLFKTVKQNIVGGPSIIFNRHQKAGETLIRGGKSCKKIVGFDANALYLLAIDQSMPVGAFVRRRASNGFKAEVRDKYVSAFNWLDHVMKRKNVNIIHQRNHGSEIRIGKYPVDGFQAPTAPGQKPVVYQFHGCYWHGHQCDVTKNVKNPKWKTTHEAKYKKTQRITEYLKKKGYHVKEMWECQFKNYCRLNPDIYQIIDANRPTFFAEFKKKKVTKEDILRAVKEEKMFGMVEVDIQVPERWSSDFQHPSMTPYEYFQEMAPLFCNTDVPIESIGTHMQDHVKKHNLSTTPRRLLVGGMKARQILLATPLLKWYLDHGMEVTQVYQVVEYRQQRCFTGFVKEVSDARRQGDIHPDKAIIADTKKVEGNSSYGSLIMDKSKHHDIQYVQGENDTCLKVNEPRFRKLECLDMEQQYYELEMAKNRIVYDLPIQLGYFILQYAKKRMLEFYYDFMDKFIDRSDFEYCEMDTDSAYMAISGSSIEEVIKPEMKEKYMKGVTGFCGDGDLEADSEYRWFPRTCCDRHKKFDKRTPGLFKLEYQGEEMISLCSKTYIVRKAVIKEPTSARNIAFNLIRKAKGLKAKRLQFKRRISNEYKFSSKGVNKRHIDKPMSIFKNVLTTEESANVINRGFRARNNTIFTYTQVKRGFSYFYCKRKVASDGIHTSPLDITLCPVTEEEQDENIRDQELIEALDGLLDEQ